MKKKTRLNPQVFRDAAAISAKVSTINSYCCWSISKAMHKNKFTDNTRYHRFLCDVLKPHGTWLSAWYNEDVDGLSFEDTCNPLLVQNARVIGLLLLALLVEEGFEP